MAILIEIPKTQGDCVHFYDASRQINLILPNSKFTGSQFFFEPGIVT
jgi:hypothetical protein